MYIQPRLTRLRKRSRCCANQVCTFATENSRWSQFDPDAVARFAQEVIAPKVREMDEAEMMDQEVIKGLFEQGVSARSSQCVYVPTSPPYS